MAFPAGGDSRGRSGQARFEFLVFIRFAPSVLGVSEPMFQDGLERGLAADAPAVASRRWWIAGPGLAGTALSGLDTAGSDFGREPIPGPGCSARGWT